MYSDEQMAELYEVLNPWSKSEEFYFPFVMEASSVLDVGCGAGMLLRAARAAGHLGRLCGIDPDPWSLAIAQRQTDIEWLECNAAALRFENEFELATMTGHAFQFLLTDEDVSESLAAIRQSLVPGGRFAFETRNPLNRAWETWTPENGYGVVDNEGRPLRVTHRLESVVGELVTVTETTSTPIGETLRVDRATLRFMGAKRLEQFLLEAGFHIEAQFGSWQGESLVESSPEIITFARV